MHSQIKRSLVLAAGVALLAGASTAGGATRPNTRLVPRLEHATINPALIRSEPKNELPFTRLVNGR